MTHPLVLVVEDKRSVIEVVTAALDGFAEIRSADSAEAVRAMLEAEEFACAFVDLHLTNSDSISEGIKVLSLLRNYPDINRSLITSHFDDVKDFEKPRRRALHHGDMSVSFAQLMKDYGLTDVLRKDGSLAAPAVLDAFRRMVDLPEERVRDLLREEANRGYDRAELRYERKMDALKFLLAKMHGDRPTEGSPFDNQMVDLRRRFSVLQLTRDEITRSFEEGSRKEAEGRLADWRLELATFMELVEAP